MSDDRIKAAQDEIQKILAPKPEYVVNTSEFNDVKARLAMMHNKRKVETEDPSRPRLRRAPGVGMDLGEQAEAFRLRPTVSRLPKQIQAVGDQVEGIVEAPLGVTQLPEAARRDCLTDTETGLTGKSQCPGLTFGPAVQPARLVAYPPEVDEADRLAGASGPALDRQRLGCAALGLV